ncbi:CPBP family intramembrane glutamic endopeptidase [Algoriella xinjiangensis]|nr:CPBP family intramembrane glutamic endopeptidase [Algoriella xinjiangensis]
MMISKDLKTQLEQINWKRILVFYSLILLGTFFVRKLPNLLQLTLGKYVDFILPWNLNHGIIVFIIALIFYKFSEVKKEISFLGIAKIKTIIFPLILIVGYSIIGINNDFGVNKHLWGCIFITVTFIYDIMEEYAWRGYLNDALGKLFWVFKSIVTGLFWAIWHLLIFDNFNQFGGFWIFALLCIVFSFILTFSTIKTKSIIVPAAMHALFSKTNITTLIIFSIFLVLLFTWNKFFVKEGIKN